MFKRSSTPSFASAAAALRFWRSHVLPQLRYEPAELALAHPWGLLAALLRAPSRLLDPLTSAHHRLADRATAALTQSPVLFPRGFFCDGWGDVATPRRVRELLQSQRMREVTPLAPADVHWGAKQLLRAARVCLQQASFASTLPNAREFLPSASLDAFCELVTPLEWEEAAGGQAGERPVQGSSSRPLVGTGEHGFLHRRTSIAVPLARKGVATLILEGPFYGRRKPSDQRGSKLRRVSDLPVLGQATIEEAKSLVAYFQQHHGYTHVVLAGSSMGGLHAAMVASVFPGEVGATAWLAPPSAVPVFADGLLAASCNWTSLYKEHELALLDKMLVGHGVAVSSAPVLDGGVSSGDFVDEDPVQQAKKRMRMFLSITDIDNFHPPARADAAVFVVGTEDEYVGATEPQWERMRRKWKPAQVRYLKTGHVTGILLEQESFRNTILEVIDILRRPSAAATLAPTDPDEQRL
ncbi:hypothetical protein PybrP1_000762 [[Pythium] brassicae (nom. inval.)]|nr:hypothetical protein PybrP1_000762 [[Pythium] brassicae (nom. inval.)]